MAPSTDPGLLTEELRQAIHAVGLKVTQPRLAVLDALLQHPHSSADEVYTVVRERLGGSSPQAVHGILAAFTGAGLTRRFVPAGSPARFECRVGDNHHHVVCVRCGAIEDVDCVIGEAPCLTPSDPSGFGILAAEVTFSGVCLGCQQTKANAAVSP